jgi:NAD(P)-dependent dehydrogenase (short-subunit alcohol dehydrogenase family)
VSHNFFDLTGQVAIITGASRGLGQYFSRALGRAGAKLIITSRKAGDCDNFIAELTGLSIEALALTLDVRDKDSIAAFGPAAETTASELGGKVDILVNNAGCNIRKPALDVSWDDWNTVVETNLRGAFFVAQTVARGMVERGYGRIVNISSVTSVFGYAGLAPYGASRGGIRQMTMSLADDWGKHGVTVNALAPGWFKTEQNKVMYEDAEWVEYLNERIPLHRPGAPDDLDGAVIFLASEASRYVTGQTLLVDGGITVGSTRAVVRK